MAGFIRRYPAFPGVETITLIEGVIIIDQTPPGQVQGVGQGVVGIVGEFPNMTYATNADLNGNIASKYRPVEIFSAQDLQNKLGGFDVTLGDFGNSCGNGFVALRNKQYQRLIAVPVNLSSPQGGRLWRQLPANISATNATPVIPMQAAGVAAGTSFKNGADLYNLAASVSFTDFSSYAAGIDGAVTPAGLPAATQDFVSASGNFVVAGVKEGDALVPDVGVPASTAVTDNPLLIGAVTANVISTTGYPATGTILIGLEYIDYAGKTATSFTGLTRGAHGSAAAAHVLGSAVTLVNDFNTYRVVSVTNATTLVIQRQDGSNFTVTNWLTAVALPWRLHVASTADTGGEHQLSEVAAYTLPVRPLTVTLAANLTILPVLAAGPATSDSWDPLSGLAMHSHPTGGFVFTASVQASNAVASPQLDVIYLAAIDSLLGDNTPEADVTLLDVARTSANIRSKQKSHVLQSSSLGRGRTTVVWPPLQTIDTAVVFGDSEPGVGAHRDERVDYAWPGVVTFVPEAVNFLIPCSDGKKAGGDALHPAGLLEVPSSGWLFSIESVLPPENNPAQSAAPVPSVMAPVAGFQYGVPTLGMNEYITMRQRGIAGMRIDRTAGPIFQSGITTSLTSGQKNINRRRMADFIEDSLARALNPFCKLPLTTSLKDAALGEVVAFLDQLLSPNNPAAQRISDYEVDSKSGNTPDLEAQGIFVIIVRVRTLATSDFIVLQASIGESVSITRS